MVQQIIIGYANSHQKYQKKDVARDNYTYMLLSITTSFTVFLFLVVLETAQVLYSSFAFQQDTGVAPYDFFPF